MSDVDTSAEACRGGVGLLRAAMTPILHSERLRLAQLIEALVAERDAERRLSAQLRREVDANITRADKAEAERDAALAERDAHKARADRYDTQAAAAEALKAERDRYIQVWTEAFKARDAALAEAARLRKALTKIAARDPNAVGSGKRAIEYDYMRYEARAALGKEAGDV